MDSIKSAQGDDSVPTVWLPTNSLRYRLEWDLDGCTPVLQQRWLSDDGDAEWRDVPVVGD